MRTSLPRDAYGPPRFATTDYGVSFRAGTANSSTALKDYVLVGAVHTHPPDLDLPFRGGPGADALGFKNDHFSMDDFNVAVFLMGTGPLDLMGGTLLERDFDKIYVITARNACIRAFKPLEGDSIFTKAELLFYEFPAAWIFTRSTSTARSGLPACSSRRPWRRLPRLHLTSFHGVFAPHSKMRAAVTPAHALVPYYLDLFPDPERVAADIPGDYLFLCQRPENRVIDHRFAIGDSLLTGPRFWAILPSVVLGYVVGSSTELLGTVAAPGLRGFALAVLAVGAWFVAGRSWEPVGSGSHKAFICEPAVPGSGFESTSTWCHTGTIDPCEAHLRINLPALNSCRNNLGIQRPRVSL